MKVHFIAIGGSAMHNLAIALHQKAYHVTGSDDEIFDPSRGRLAKHGLLPPSLGWDANRIHPDLDAVILGMHARADNPELMRARELGLPIYSYPEYLYQQSTGKKRIVIGGSHGKTTITAMVLHALRYHGIPADYMIGAQLDGFDVMVKLSEEAEFMVLEGDEYPSSPIDPRPKFHLYRPHLALLTGIAWDHINVFPTMDQYLEQFRLFIQSLEEGGTLFYCREDPLLTRLCRESAGPSIKRLSYGLPRYHIKNGVTFLSSRGKEIPLQVFGRHNLLNMAGAQKICARLGMTTSGFYTAMTTFKGASRRLQKIWDAGGLTVFRDFAHAPSKLKATLDAVREQFPRRRLVAFMELHTYSSLNRHFLPEYRHSMQSADEAYVFYNPRALELKKLPGISPADIRDGFGQAQLHVINDPVLLSRSMARSLDSEVVLLLMSSGDFAGIDLPGMLRHFYVDAEKESRS